MDLLDSLKGKKVFPAYAGMNRRRWPATAGARGVPRLRGDEPAILSACNGRASCSPPTRG